jgi:Domain of unknown function (DUF4111)
MSDAQMDELVPSESRAKLAEAGLLDKDVSAADLRQMLIKMNADFRDTAPVSAAEAATTILDGVRSGPGGSWSARKPRCSTQRCARNPRPSTNPSSSASWQRTSSAMTARVGRADRGELKDDDGRVLRSEVAVFGCHVAGALARTLGADLVGVYFVGSVALGGYVPGESDIDIAAVSSAELTDPQRQAVASAVIEASAACPARGLEFTLYRREVAGSRPAGADFEVNANGGPRMPTAVHMEATTEPGFWYVLDRAIAHRSGLAISGPPARRIFADIPRRTLLEAMCASMAWHGVHEKATLYSVLNACRAWRFAAVNVLGSKLEGAAWARARWRDTGVIEAAVALRCGENAALDETAVDALLSAVTTRLQEAAEA